MASNKIDRMGFFPRGDPSLDERPSPKLPPLIARVREFSQLEAQKGIGDGHSKFARAGDDEVPWIALARWRKAVVMAGLFKGLFFATLDTAIVSTSLITIVTDLGDFQRSPWIVVAYLLLYMCMAVVFARLSDVYGRKPMVLTAWIIFTSFSLGCGAARTMTQLIVFRALQGVGGSGLFSLTMIMIPEIVTPERMGFASGMFGIVLACSQVLGPILGGFVTHFTTWRWIFYINVPHGIVVIGSILFLWPRTPGLPLSSMAAFQSIDFVGIGLILAASIMLIWSFQSVSVGDYDWGSHLIVTVLLVAGWCWILFAIWELFLESRKESTIKPIFPFRIVKKRVMASVVAYTFLTGFPYIVTIIVLPERFQIVNGVSSLMAGVYLLPLLGASALGSYLGGKISSKRNLTSYALIASSIPQLVGCGLLSSFGDRVDTPAQHFVYEVILGLGFGVSLSTATIMTSVQAQRGDIAATQGAVAQVRVLGGVIGLTIVTTLFNRRSLSAFSTFLSPTELSALHVSPSAIISLSPDDQLRVRSIYADLFSLDMRIMMYICAVALIVSLASWEKNPPDVRKRMQAHRKGGPGPGPLARVVVEKPSRK